MIQHLSLIDSNFSKKLETRSPKKTNKVRGESHIDFRRQWVLMTLAGRGVIASDV